MRAFAISVLCLTVLGGCLGGPTQPSRYYLLAADPDLAPAAAAVADEVTIAVGPVNVPSHLDRQQIVTRKDRYRLELAEFDLWAEPLHENLARILVENLSRLLGTDKVLGFGERRGGGVDYEVAVDVEAMDVVAGDGAELVARWTLTRTRGHEVLFIRRSRLRAPLADDRFESVAAAMSRDVSALSREIATAITQLTP